MSEEENHKPGAPNRAPRPERFQSKVLFIWLGILTAILLLWSYYPGEHIGLRQVSLNEVLNKADSGELKSLYLKSEPSGGANWFKVWGEMKNPDLGSDKIEDKAKLSDYIGFQSTGILTEERFNQLTAPGRSYTVVEEPASTVMKDILISLLPFVLIIALLYFLFVRQLRMAGKGAMSFGKSRAKLLTRDKDRVCFKDVAGCDEAKEEVQEIVEFLKDPKKFQRIGGRVPKGVLMMGPPGTGKTLLAKAVAGEAEVPFFSISGSDFVEMFVGVGASRVRDMFEQGRKSAPCIIFIDEIDAVGRQRGAGLGGGNDEREQTLNSLLVEMDGFDGHEGVIIIAATNRPDVLDSALLRPGRFDRQITIDLPDLNGREEILKVHARKIKMGKDIDLGRVARSTPGFSGADLSNLLNEAALIAARHGKTEVAMCDIEEARDKIAYGRERRKLMDDEDKRMTAYHEAGHALIQVMLDDKKLKLHKVTIIPRGRALGMTMFTPTKDILGRSRKDLLNQICMAMGGRIGEEVETGDFSNGAYGDIKHATELARHMVCDWGMSELGPVAYGENQEQIFLAREITRSQNYSEETARQIDREIHKIIDSQYRRAEQIIRENRELLEKIADALLKYETIDGVHVEELIKYGEIRTPVINNPVKKPESDAEEKQSSKTASKGEDENEGLGSTAQPAGAPA